MASDLKLADVLRRIDGFIARSEWAPDAPAAEPFEPTWPAAIDVGRETVDLRSAGIKTVIWATGFRRAYPWLKVPVFDDDGEIRHRSGVTPVAGLYVLGMHFQRRRKSAFIDGVGDDAAFLAHRIAIAVRASGEVRERGAIPWPAPTGELKSRYDAVVVGARCAGAATAMLLARRGLDVLVVEQGERGADTLSTLALMRAGVLQLSRWGLLDGVRAASPPIRTTTFHYGGAAAVEIRIKPRDGVDALYAPRRTVLDPLLADAAEAAGADVAYRTRLVDLQRDRGRVRGAIVEGHDGAPRSIAAGIVIGADGVQSIVARLCDAEPQRFGAHAGAVIYTFCRGLDVEGYHWYYAPGVSAGVIPTGGGDVLVFAAVPRARFMRELRFNLPAGFHGVIEAAAPRLAPAVRAAAPVGPYRGFAGHTGYLRPAWGPGWALVGDAGYFKDPITAHGISDALRDAELLARAIEGGADTDFAAYQTIRDDLSLPLFEYTDEIASFAWDFARLQTLHKKMSDEMAREVLYLRDLTEAVGEAQGTRNT